MAEEEKREGDPAKKKTINRWTKKLLPHLRLIPWKSSSQGDGSSGSS